MQTDWWNFWVAVFGIVVTVTLTLASVSSGRTARRGVQATTAFALVRELRAFTPEARELDAGSTNASIEADQRILRNMEDAARLASSEYARLLLRDGWSWTVITMLVTYGVMFFWIGSARMNDPAVGDLVSFVAGGIFVLLGVLLFVMGIVAVLIRSGRRRRAREAGLNAPSLREEAVESLRLVVAGFASLPARIRNRREREQLRTLGRERDR